MGYSPWGRRVRHDWVTKLQHSLATTAITWVSPRIPVTSNYSTITPRQDFQGHSRFINSALGNLAAARRNCGTDIKKTRPGAVAYVCSTVWYLTCNWIHPLAFPSDLNPEKWSMTMESFFKSEKECSQRLFPRSMCKIKVTVHKFYFGLTLDNVIVSVGKLWS